MVDWLVFSRDRACQLDALLRSIERNAPELVRTVTVLYNATTREHGQGYDVVRSAWPWAWLVPDIDFADQVRAWTRQATDRVGFLCDDDLFYRPAPAPFELPLPFAYRLGLNCRRQHPTGREQELPLESLRGSTVVDEHGATLSDLIAWDWRGADGDFGYPFSLDGHVYPRELALSLVEGSDFSDPTTLEAGVVSKVVAGELDFPARYAAPAHSALVSIPANRVTENARNPVMGNGPSPDDLLALYLRQRRVDLDRMDFDGVAGAHWEVPYVLAP